MQSKLTLNERLELIERHSPHFFRFIKAIEKLPWVNLDDFLNKLTLDDFSQLKIVNAYLSGKLYDRALAVMQSELIGISLSELLVVLQDNELTNRLFVYNTKYARVIKLWFDFTRENINNHTLIKKFRDMLCNRVKVQPDPEEVFRFLETILNYPHIGRFMLDNNARAIGILVDIWEGATWVFHRLAKAISVTNESKKEKARKHVLSPLIDHMEKENFDEDEKREYVSFVDAILSKGQSLAQMNQANDPTVESALGNNNAGNSQMVEVVADKNQDYIAELQNYISILSYVPLSRDSLKKQFDDEMLNEFKANKNNVKVSAARKLVMQLNGINVNVTPAERDALMDGKLLKIQAKHLSEIDLLKRYVYFRGKQKEGFFSHPIYTEELKLRAAKKRIAEIESGAKASYTFFEKKALNQGRLGVIENLHSKRKPG